LDLSALRELNDKFGHLFKKGSSQPKPPPVTPPNDTDVAF
jgi:hypothetical protein